jgi:uncharacterized protein YdbL (DUF1318 family)
MTYSKKKVCSKPARTECFTTLKGLKNKDTIMKTTRTQVKPLKKFLHAGIAITALLISISTWAIDIQSAKEQGLIGEQANGYVGIVKSSPEVEALVSDVNQKRKARYIEISGKTGQPLSAIEKIGGEKAISKTESGQFIKPAGSDWTKK